MCGMVTNEQPVKPERLRLRAPRRPQDQSDPAGPARSVGLPGNAAQQPVMPEAMLQVQL